MTEASDDRIRRALGEAADEWVPSRPTGEARRQLMSVLVRRHHRARMELGIVAGLALVVGLVVVPLAWASGGRSNHVVVRSANGPPAAGGQPAPGGPHPDDAPSAQDQARPGAVGSGQTPPVGPRTTAGPATPTQRRPPSPNDSPAPPATAPTDSLPPPTSTSAPTGAAGVRGTVLFSPVCPVERVPPDPACAPRPGSAHIRLVGGDGGVAAEATAGPDGTFEITVAPGVYAIEAEAPSPGRGCATTPSSVTVTAGSYTLVGVSCDTGIR